MAYSVSDWQRLDQFLGQAAEGGVIPAAVLHVRQQGKVVYEQVVGWLEPETRHYPANLETYFDLASLTKLFTTTAFLRLAAAENVQLEMPVAEVLPAFVGLRPIQPYEDPLRPGEFVVVHQGTGWVDAGKVTFHQLLTHRSGLPAWRPLFRQPPDTIRDMVLTTFFSYPTQATVVYSDLGFILLGWVIEQLTREQLDEAIKQLVFAPLDLSTIHYRPRSTAMNNETMNNEQCAPTEHCLWRERRIQGEVHDENAWAMGGISGHAGLFGSAADVARLGQAWLDALNGTSTFLPQSLAQEATSLQAEAGNVRRGLGWALWSPDPEAALHVLSRESFGHTGFTGTSLYVDPERQLVIACLTNEVYFGRQNRSIGSFRLALNELIVDGMDRV